MAQRDAVHVLGDATFRVNRIAANMHQSDDAVVQTAIAQDQNYSNTQETACQQMTYRCLSYTGAVRPVIHIVVPEQTAEHNNTNNTNNTTTQQHTGIIYSYIYSLLSTALGIIYM